MLASSLKSLLAFFFALIALVAISHAAPLTSEQLATRSTKIEALRSKLIEKRLFAKEKAHLAADIAAFKVVEKWRGTKHDNNPQDCGFGRIVCPVSYNGIGHPICDFGNCKLQCPRGLRQFFSRHPEFPSFCA
ncbi:hypothetical protein JCM3765_007178 [Sporobolomyces pararoseus]